MAFDFGSYDPTNPFGFGGADLTMPGGISQPFTGGSGFPASGGTSFPGYDFGLGYPVGATGSAASENIISKLAEKVGPTAAKSLFRQFLDTKDPKDLLGLLGAAAPGLIGEYLNSQRASQLSGSLTGIANQARADRSPFLDYATKTLQGGPEAYAAGPGSQALKGVLAKLSASFGNPIGAPAALGIATDSALNNWGNDWRQAANIGLGGNYSQLATNAATAAYPQNYGAGLGDAAASVFAPQQRSLADLMKSLNLSGLT